MKLVRLLLPLLLLATPARGQSVYLLTVGTGDALWEKYGHNALWIHDPEAGIDWVLNYGVFDFDAPGYWGRFIRGDWLYQMAVFDIQGTLDHYRENNRTVVAQELALTDQQKAELIAFAEWNYRPENREYLYDYFLDNCSTRIRDVLDDVLGGQLSAATKGVETGTTFRWHSRRLMAGSPVVYTALNAGLGPATDRPIDQWEEMFLPEKVRARVAELQVVGENGETRPLVIGERVLNEAIGRAPDREAPPNWLAAHLGIGLAFGALFLGLGAAAQRSAWGRFGLALTGSLWVLLLGLGGLLLTGLWAFTNHTAAHRNENLFQFVPLDILLVIPLSAAVYGARWAQRVTRPLALIVAAAALLGFVIQLLPGFDQVNGEIIALLMPGTLALAWVFGRESILARWRRPDADPT